MIAIPRDLARRFRAVAKKCLAGRPRAPASPVVCRVQAGALSLWTRIEFVGLLYSMPSPGPNEKLVVPMDVFAAIEGTESDPVELSAGPKLQGLAKWVDRGVPQSKPFEAIAAGKPHAIPDRPDNLGPIARELLRALHECGRTAAREGGRFALDRIQLRGKAGQVVGTDSKQALVWGGITFPFPDDILVHAIPAFGCRELIGERADVQIGLGSAELVVAIGPWSVFLPIDATGKYPDVSPILIRPGAGSVANIDSRDAADLLPVLPALPGADDENRPVTLDLDRGVTIRARDDKTGLMREVSLSRSRAGGEPIRVAVNRTFLARALELGCHTIRLNPTGSILSAEGANRTFLVAALDRQHVAKPADSATPSNADGSRSSRPERSSTMKAPEANGHSANGRHDPPDEEFFDPLTEAEALRNAIAELGLRLGRLIAALRQSNREKKTLANVWAGLKQLNLGGRSA